MRIASQSATGCTLACLGTTVPHHSPTWALAVRRFPLESPKYGRFARPYFFGESHPCFADCFAIRDRLFLFRARFAARHVSRLGRFFCVLSRLMSLAYQKGKLRSIRRKILAKSLARYFTVSLERLTFLRNFSLRISALPFPNLGACCKASCLHQFFRIDPFCESCSTVPCSNCLTFREEKDIITML